MRAGERNRRPLVEELVLPQDGAGGHTEEWVSLGNVWAAIEPLSGREQSKAGREEDVGTHRVIVLKAAGLPGYHLRFTDAGRVLRQRGPSRDLSSSDVEYICEDVGPVPTETPAEVA